MLGRLEHAFGWALGALLARPLRPVTEMLRCLGECEPWATDERESDTSAAQGATVANQG